MSRQAAQRKLDHHNAMPIAPDCAKFPDFPELMAMSRACDAWLKKRGLMTEFVDFGYGRKTKNQQIENKHDDEKTVF
jgi:hypothetical protein